MSESLRYFELNCPEFGNPNWVAYKTIARTEIRRITRIWIQTLVPPVITMTLYFIIFGSLIGKRIGTMAGFDYMSYIVPGLVMMSLITNSYGNVSSSFFGSKFGRFIEEILVSPVSYNVLLIGYVTGGVVRGTTISVLVLLIATFFTNLSVYNLPTLVIVIFLTSLLFSILGFINGLFARRFDDITVIPHFVLTPLTYLGGVFFSVDLLPEVWQWVSLLNPVFYVVNAARYGVLGVSDVSVLLGLFMLCMMTLVAYLYALRLLKHGNGSQILS